MLYIQVVEEERDNVRDKVSLESLTYRASPILPLEVRANQIPQQDHKHTTYKEGGGRGILTIHVLINGTHPGQWEHTDFK